MLRVEELSKSFSGFEVKDVSFHLPKGYICGLIGENGAGKTTLIKMIIGLYRKTGSCLVDGKEFMEHEAEIKDRLGLILDECLFEKNATPEMIGILYGPLYSAYDEKVYQQYLDRFGLDPKQKLKKLSKGMLIKFQLAFALSHDAKLFIFDEPTGGLDEEFREEFYQICSELVADQERSVLISTHITTDLDRIADYLAYMQDGELMFYQEKDAVLDRFAIVQAENYKLKLLPKDYVVYMEEGQYSGKAMVVKRKSYAFDAAYTLSRPNIQELMYYLVKGGHKRAKDIAETFLS